MGYDEQLARIARARRIPASIARGLPLSGFAEVLELVSPFFEKLCSVARRRRNSRYLLEVLWLSRWWTRTAARTAPDTRVAQIHAQVHILEVRRMVSVVEATHRVHADRRIKNPLAET